MIRISDPAKLGQTLGTLRIADGWTRAGLGHYLAALGYDLALIPREDA